MKMRLRHLQDEIGVLELVDGEDVVVAANFGEALTKKRLALHQLVEKKRPGRRVFCKMEMKGRDERKG